MGTEAINYVLGQQCAPVIAGVKPSNLLIVEKGNQRGLQRVLVGTGLCRFLLYTSEEKDYWLLFDPEVLKELIKQEETAQYLRDCGYRIHLSAVLLRLSKRFSVYKRTGNGFPHEMGVLFGYPLGDVLGFIENGGKNFKLSGYWKVYQDVEGASRMFRLYEQVKQTALKLVGQGKGISDVRNYYRMSESPTFGWN